MTLEAGTVTSATDQATEAVGAEVDDTSATPAVTPPAEPEAAGAGAETADDAPVVEGEDIGGEDDESLISHEEYESLKSNPAALKKALNRSYTQKMQALSEARNLQEAVRRDPLGVARELARRAGRDLTERPPQPEIDEFRAALADQFGEETADKIVPVFEQRLSKIIEAKLGPIEANNQRALAVAAVTESKAVMDAFKAQHPDYKTYEPLMVQIGSKFQSAPGAMTEAEYLENLYTLAKARNPAAMAREMNERAVRAARAAERPGGGTPPSKITTGPPDGPVSTEDAVRAAFRGEDWYGKGKQ